MTEGAHQVVLHPDGGHHLDDAPLDVELTLEVWDSPNSARVVIDALRCSKLRWTGTLRCLYGAIEAKVSATQRILDQLAAVRRLTVWA